jgi:hypothetical protein
MSVRDRVSIRPADRRGEAADSGRPLDAGVRAWAEGALGHDFSSVRIHAGDAAARAARAEGAVAYGVGEHLVFGAAAFAPGTPAGDRLLAHELAHVAQQRGGTAAGHGRAADARTAEREADGAAAHAVARRRGRAALSRRPVGIHRQRPVSAPSVPPTTTPRGRFEHWLAMRFPGVRVVNGTRERQTQEVFSRRVQGRPTTIPADQRVLPNWQPWTETAAAADLYDNATRAIEDVAATFGGSPNITEVVLYATEYTLTAAGAVPTANVGASFGAGELTIYGTATTMTKWLPVARSTTSGRYPMVAVGVGGLTGQSPGAPIPFPSRAESQRRTIAHELGHGVAEAAHAVEPGVFDAWNRAVGWHNGSLYDVQASGVTAALAAGTAPPASALITVNDWNSPAHGEQPMTDYAVSGGPAEDFAESVMAFVYEPALLRGRSPARYAFMQARRTTLIPQLVPLPPVGDFPVPRGETRVA